MEIGSVFDKAKSGEKNTEENMDCEFCERKHVRAATSMNEDEEERKEV